MKAGQYYYAPNISTLIVGFIEDGRLKGKVIYSHYGTFPIGYKYDAWTDVIMVNRRAVHGSYHDFLNGVETDEIGYGKTKALLNTREIVKHDQMKNENVFSTGVLHLVKY